MVGQNTATLPVAYGSLLPCSDRISESFIEIRETNDRDLITVIELLLGGGFRRGDPSRRRDWRGAAVGFAPAS